MWCFCTEGPQINCEWSTCSVSVSFLCSHSNSADGELNTFAFLHGLVSVLFFSVLFLFINHDSCLDPEKAKVQWWDGFDQQISSHLIHSAAWGLWPTLTCTHTAHTLSNEVLVLQSPSSIYIENTLPKGLYYGSHNSQKGSIYSSSTDSRPLWRREKEQREFKQKGRRGNSVAETQKRLLHSKSGT